MDQVKIGKFISERRKMMNLTQAQLAEKLNITDRAVSKWETGKTMPDSSIMLELCGILKISVNDLLCGEVISMDNYNEKSEKIILDMIKQKEQSDKRLLFVEIVLGIVGIFPLIGAFCIAFLVPDMEEWLQEVIIAVGVIPLLVAAPFALRIEQKAGYYKCAKCNHLYVPSYKSVFLAPHINRTRYMKCPKCGEKSWQKKVVSKDPDNK